MFDRDAFPAGNFNSAIAKAEANGFRVAYSNESFELWYVLHFGYHQSASTRGELCDKLSRLLGHSYDKNSTTMYETLRPNQLEAIRNAKALLKFHDVLTPEQCNPSTKVFELVEALNRSAH